MTYEQLPLIGVGLTDKHGRHVFEWICTIYYPVRRVREYEKVHLPAHHPAELDAGPQGCRRTCTRVE